MDLSRVLEIASHTDPGMVRSHNEDSIASIADKGLVVLADGMGGYNAGEVASGMGTTLVVALFYDDKMMVAHIGDSRLYRMRGDEFGQVTKDHSLLQEQIDAGMLTKEQAKQSSNKNLVTRALGIDPAVEPEIHEYDTEPGDIYLLCSDGLSDMVSDEDIGMTLEALGANLNLAAQQLVQMANDNGGRDNISVILIKILSKYPAGKGLASKI